MAASVPSRAEFGDIVRNLVHACRRSGVDVRLGVGGRRRRRAGRTTRRGRGRHRRRARPAVLGTGRRRHGGRRARRSRGPSPPGRATSWSSTSSASTKRPRSPSCSPTAAARSRSSRPGMVVGQDLGITLDLEHWNVRAAAKGIAQTHRPRPDGLDTGHADRAAPPDRPERRPRAATGSCSRCRNNRSSGCTSSSSDARRCRGPPRRRLRRAAPSARCRDRRRTASGPRCDDGCSRSSSCVTACCPRVRTSASPKRAATRCCVGSRHGRRGEATGGRGDGGMSPRLGAFAPGGMGRALGTAARSGARRACSPRRPTAVTSRPGSRTRSARPLLAGAVAVDEHQVDARAQAAVCSQRRTSIDRCRGRDARAGCARCRAARDAADDRRTSTCTSSPAHDAEVVEVLPPDPATVDLAEATRIVAGGAGLGGPEPFAVLQRVAVRARRRRMAPAGWRPMLAGCRRTASSAPPAWPSTPTLYVAFGISGAVQHVSGLGDPDHVIAVNTDAERADDGHGRPGHRHRCEGVAGRARPRLDVLDDELSVRRRRRRSGPGRVDCRAGAGAGRPAGRAGRARSVPRLEEHVRRCRVRPRPRPADPEVVGGGAGRSAGSPGGPPCCSPRRRASPSTSGHNGGAIALQRLHHLPARTSTRGWRARRKRRAPC